MSKAPLTPNYLSKKGGRWRELKLSDVVTLLQMVLEGAKEDRVGFEDAGRTLAELKRHLNRIRLAVDPSVLESALWSCNLMDEIGKFRDAEGRSFDEFVRAVLPRDEKFNRFYNLIEKKNGDSNE